MKIIKPYFTILHELDRQSLAVRIEYSGRICYKSEDSINQNSAIPFVRKMAEYGHNSVLEMGVITFRVFGATQQQLDSFYTCIPRYLQVDSEQENLLITGSVRAYRELFLKYPDNDIVLSFTTFLAKRHPYFYDKIREQGIPSSPSNLSIEKIDLEDIEKFNTDLLARHRHLAIKFVVNRAVTHEIVRHRPCAFLQESQRYCRYSTDKFGNEVTFIQPLFYEEGTSEFEKWQQAMESTEKIYLNLLETSTPQAARTVLPNSCKTEIIVYANLFEWKHILSLRTPKNADPSMREIMIPLHQELKKLYPDLFQELQ